MIIKQKNCPDNLISLISLRADVRNKIRMLIFLGIKTSHDSSVMAEYITTLDTLHSEILPYELDSIKLPKIIIGFSVCGYSPEHGYFRNKYGTFNSIEIAQSNMKKLAEDPQWNIPTIILEENWLRKECPPLVDFDKTPNDYNNLGFSHTQEIVDKLLIDKNYRWKEILKPDRGRYTY